MDGKSQIRLILRALRLDFTEELRFHEKRRWRFDFAVQDLRLAIEYDGHGQTGGKRHVGRHGSITGMSGDHEKLNQAALAGWTVLRFTALHFDFKARMKNKLTAPRETIEALVAAVTDPG